MASTVRVDLTDAHEAHGCLILDHSLGLPDRVIYRKGDRRFYPAYAHVSESRLVVQADVTEIFFEFD